MPLGGAADAWWHDRATEALRRPALLRLHLTVG
ncbi:hypothetical protein EDD27_6602 [Nonomuraea polychroma]|uniref:Uncharacterized protein n=1 Tax=Nonomuraea polychroma TaxID=46176 RepID=A0A438MDT4_9ACTN|nr:hypothetical protein EDD27_6602 [Nonomuraea polychroma]